MLNKTERQEIKRNFVGEMVRKGSGRTRVQKKPAPTPMPFAFETDRALKKGYDEEN